MRSSLLLLSFVFMSMVVSAQTSIKAEDASKYVGQVVTVCSKVFGVKYLEKSKSQFTFINVGAAYPNSPLTILIEPKDRENFPTKPEELYKDKNICVTGTVVEFKGKFEIHIKKPEEIVVQ